VGADKKGKYTVKVKLDVGPYQKQRQLQATKSIEM
jgi:hypothetical protein